MRSPTGCPSRAREKSRRDTTIRSARSLPVDKRVIQIDTLVIGNGCAKESTTQGVITTLVHAFPDFVRVNRERANLTGLPLASAARSYYEEDGPDLVGEHVPWIIDIMPTARWLQLFFAVSLLFGAMAALHRFRLWRLDAARVRIEDDVSRLFGPGHHGRRDRGDEAGGPTSNARGARRLDAVMRDLGQLGERCRRQSLSMLVPMGHEMAYRYQEGLDRGSAARAAQVSLAARSLSERRGLGARAHEKGSRSCPFDDRRSVQPAGVDSAGCGARAAASSSAAAFIDSRTRPLSSASSTLTRTIWPSFR